MPTKTPPRDEAKISQGIEWLKAYAAQLPHLVDVEFPPGEPIPENTQPTSCEYPLKVLAGQIDNILGSFDILQEGLGMKRTHTRHNYFLTGKCTCR